MNFGEYGLVVPFNVQYTGQFINTLTPTGKLVTRNHQTAVALQSSNEIHTPKLQKYKQKFEDKADAIHTKLSNMANIDKVSNQRSNRKYDFKPYSIRNDRKVNLLLRTSTIYDPSRRFYIHLY